MCNAVQPSAAQKHDLPCGIESDQSVFLSVFPHDSSLSLFVFFRDMTYWLTLHSMNYTSICSICTVLWYYFTYNLYRWLFWFFRCISFCWRPGSDCSGLVELQEGARSSTGTGLSGLEEFGKLSFSVSKRNGWSSAFDWQRKLRVLQNAKPTNNLFPWVGFAFSLVGHFRKELGATKKVWC